jgi:hypothetical protein
MCIEVFLQRKGKKWSNLLALLVGTGRPEQGRPEEGLRATGGGAPGDRTRGAGPEKGRGRPEETTINSAAAESGEAAAPSGWAAVAARPSSSCEGKDRRRTTNQTPSPNPILSAPSIILRKKCGGLNGLDRAEPGSARASYGPTLQTRLGPCC